MVRRYVIVVLKQRALLVTKCGDHAILWLRDLGLPRLRAVDLGFWLWIGGGASLLSCFDAT